jgi:hypothetical protein
MRYARLNVECLLLKKKLFTKVYPKLFFSSDINGRVKQAQIFNFWTTTFEKKSKIVKNFDFFGLFSTFEAKARPSALKNLQNCRTIVVSYKCSHLLRPQL